MKDPSHGLTPSNPWSYIKGTEFRNVAILDFAILNSDIPIDLISIFVLYVHRNVPIQLQPLHLLTSRLPLKDHADLSRFLGPN